VTALHGFLRILLVALLCCASVAGAEDPLHEQTEQFFSLPLDGAITLENTDGSIHVFGWYEPRVRLVALRNAYTAPRLAQIRAETKLAPNSLAVRSVIPPVHGIFADRSGTIDYTLNVPETAHLQLKLTTGEVTLQGLRGGSASIELTNGRISALNCFARVDASSRNGVMEVFFDWWENLPATFDYALQHGRIGAILPPMARFRVEAETLNGRIGNGFGLKNQPELGRGQELKGATATDTPLTLRFHTGGGNISIDRHP
jgi:hypothetical protein